MGKVGYRDSIYDNVYSDADSVFNGVERIKRRGIMDLKGLSIDALKVLAYNEIQKLEIAQKILRAINQEIASKQIAEKPEGVVETNCEDKT